MTVLSVRMSTRDVAAALLVILLWGLNFVPTKYALGELTALQLGAARFLLAAFPLVLLVPRPRLPVGWILLYALTQGVGQYGFLFFALNAGMTAALASVLMQTQIFFTALLGVTLLGERLSLALRAGMLMAAGGVACFAISFFSDSAAGAMGALGFMLVLIAASLWATSNIVVKKIQVAGLAYSPLSLVVWSSLVSGVTFALLSLGVDDPATRRVWLEAPPGVWLALLYLGWGGNGLAFWLWTVLLTRYPASHVAPFSLGIPVIGLMAGIVLLGEKLTALQWLGTALVLSALIFVVLSSVRSFGLMMQRYGRRD